MKTRKRGAALLAALALSLGLCACGSSTPSGVQQPSPEQQTPPPAVEEVEPVEEPEYVEPAYEESEYEEPEPAEPPHGLVFVKEWFLADVKNYGVFCFNPDTKEETCIANFWVPYQDSSGNIFADSAVGLTVTRQYFSSDYTKMSDQKILAANGERHAGWHNKGETSSVFTDVTEALGQQSKSDFEDPVYYRGLGFAGENFGYAHSSDGSLLKEENFYIPIDNLSLDAVQEGDVHKVGHPYNEKGALMLNKYGSGKYLPQEVTAWIDDTHAIVNLRETGNYGSFIVDTAAQTETAYIPGDSRYNWDGVLSPDGTKIAFVSEPKNGTDIRTDLYIIPVGGGDPVKVEGHPYDLQGKSSQTRDGRTVLIDWI